MPRWIRVIVPVLVLLLSSALVIAQEGNANVIDMAERLNVRSAPTGRADVVGDVGGNDPLNVIGRNSTNRWYQISTLDGSVSGWVASGFVDLRVALADIPVVNATAPADTGAQTNAASESAAPVTTVSGAQGTVNAFAVNMRASSNTRAAILAELPSGTVVDIIGRNSSATWVQVSYNGQSGWIFASLLDLNVRITELPAVSNALINSTAASNADTTTGNSESVDVAVPAGEAPYFTLGASANNIFAEGQALGNRPNVFSKIGDSITVDEQVFGPFGFGVYNLGDYDYLRPTISFFSAQARNNNSFNNTSLAAGGGYSSRTVLDINVTNTRVCEFGESPLGCELRLTRPSVALIMLGTNDTTMVPINEFAANMRVIVDYTANQGVIPVMTTIPPRLQYPGRAESYNQVILEIAQSRGLPLIDFYGAVVGLPEAGMDDDGIHPSSPPLGFEQAGDFRGNNLQYGYTMRNLTILQALHSLRVNVLR